MYATDTNIYDPRYLLLDRFLLAKRKNPLFSLRSFAIKLGISPSALSEILSGKRTLTKKTVLRFAHRLRLTEEEAQILIKSSLLSKIHSSLPNDKELNRITDKSFISLDIETFKVIADWYHLAILSLAEIDENRTDPLWISARLGISKVQAEGALTRLLSLGLIKRKGKSFVPAGKPVSIETKGYEPAIRSFLHQNLDKAHHSLEHDPAEVREFCAATVAIDPENIAKAREAVKRFRRELTRLLENGKKQKVYTFCFQLFPVNALERNNHNNHKGVVI